MKLTVENEQNTNTLSYKMMAQENCYSPSFWALSNIHNYGGLTLALNVFIKSLSDKPHKIKP